MTEKELEAHLSGLRSEVSHVKEILLQRLSQVETAISRLHGHTASLDTRIRLAESLLAEQRGRSSSASAAWAFALAVLSLAVAAASAWIAARR